MIKANELRVGNWVNRNDLDGVYTVRSVCIDRVHPINLIERDSVKNINWACECALSELEPIPLTPEILEKAGFEEDKLHECYVIWNSVSNVAIEFFDNQLQLVGQNSAEEIGHIKHLHQLQNLYFALTGEELNINL